VLVSSEVRDWLTAARVTLGGFSTIAEPEIGNANTTNHSGLGWVDMETRS
jgi:hypothetical protein